MSPVPIGYSWCGFAFKSQLKGFESNEKTSFECKRLKILSTFMLPEFSTLQHQQIRI